MYRLDDDVELGELAGLLEVRQQLATTQGSLSHANTDNRNLKEENMVDLNTIIIR